MDDKISLGVTNIMQAALEWWDGLLDDSRKNLVVNYYSKSQTVLPEEILNMYVRENNIYVIIDLINMDFMKDEDGKIKYYDSVETANEICGMYELENVWVLKLVYNYVEELIWKE